MPVLSPSEIREYLDNIIENEPKRYAKWLAHAQKMINIVSRKAPTMKNLSASDILNELIEKLYSGERSYDSECYPDFDFFINYGISSVAKNLSYHARKEKRIFVPIADDNNEDEDGEPIGFNLKNIEGDTKSPLLESIDREFIDSCLAAVEHNPVYYFVLEKILEGHTIASAAEALGMTPNEVTSARRQVFKILSEKQKEYRS